MAAREDQIEGNVSRWIGNDARLRASRRRECGGESAEKKEEKITQAVRRKATHDRNTSPPFQTNFTQINELFQASLGCPIDSVGTEA